MNPPTPGLPVGGASAPTLLPGRNASRLGLKAFLQGLQRQARCRACPQCQKLMKPVMISALVKSMKNAPTSGATRNARGAMP